MSTIHCSECSFTTIESKRPQNRVINLAEDHENEGAGLNS